MQRINTKNGLFKDKNPLTGEGGTRITAKWLNGVQEELAGVVETFGGELDGTPNQIAQILKEELNGKASAEGLSYAINRMNNLVVEVNTPQEEAQAFANGALIVIRLDLLTGKELTKVAINQNGKAYIMVPTKHLQMGLANILISSLKTMSGRAAILAAGTRQKQITGKSKILNTVTSSYLMQGLSKITAISTKQQNAISRINAVNSKSITGKADVRRVSSAEMFGQSKILVNGVGVQTQSGKSSVLRQMTQQAQGKARINKVTTSQMQGLAKILNIVNKALTGKANVIKVNSMVQNGKSAIQIGTNKTVTGKSNISGTSSKQITGKSNISILNSKTVSGKADIRVSTSKSQLGVSRVNKVVVKTQTGKADIKNSTTKTQTGISKIGAVVQTRTKMMTGAANIAAAAGGGTYVSSYTWIHQTTDMLGWNVDSVGWTATSKILMTDWNAPAEGQIKYAPSFGDLWDILRIKWKHFVSSGIWFNDEGGDYEYSAITYISLWKTTEIHAGAGSITIQGGNATASCKVVIDGTEIFSSPETKDVAVFNFTVPSNLAGTNRLVEFRIGSPDPNGTWPSLDGIGDAAIGNITFPA